MKRVIKTLLLTLALTSVSAYSAEDMYECKKIQGENGVAYNLEANVFISDEKPSDSKAFFNFWDGQVVIKYPQVHGNFAVYEAKTKAYGQTMVELEINVNDKREAKVRICTDQGTDYFACFRNNMGDCYLRPF